jgi:hypothetical protein
LYIPTSFLNVLTLRLDRLMPREQANAGHRIYLDGEPSSFRTVDLIIADMPEDLHVPGMGSGVPAWNKLQGDEYEIVLKFVSKYLQDDGGLILLMPIGLVDSLVDDIRLRKNGFTIHVDWLCQQPHPLAHPHYNQKMVRFVAFML